MGTVFLAVALCFNIECTDMQIYISEQFTTQEDAATCDGKAESKALELLASGVINYRVGCRTQRQLESEGV